MKKFLGGILGFLLLPILIFSVYAADPDHTTSYQTDYYVRQNGDQIQTDVSYQIRITNLRSDVYVKKFTLAFPDTFSISNISASDDKGPIAPLVTDEAGNIKIVLEFSDPNTGRDSVNTFRLNFTQDNLFKLNGNVWEVILPTLETPDGAYQVVVHLPPGDNKITVAKPVPDNVTPDESVPGGRKVIWSNPKTRTIYAIFGERQLYRSELVYNLKNTRLTPIYTEIALPPDTAFQKIYINSLQPPPSKVYQDEDGNYLAEYHLNPKETKTVIFKGTIEMNSKPREDIALLNKSIPTALRSKLLTPKKYWTVSHPEEYAGLKTPQDIYNYVVKTLKYDYERSATNNTRLGAEAVLLSPDKAVCVEFSDLFIAIAREKGILAREVQGYGFASDSRLRPLSLLSDVLHSWPEYYDETSGRWTPVDPTWENTSGIDYFNSFDLNHVVFAIHGLEPEYPLPAGMYKVENSKDITLTATQEQPVEKKDLVIALENPPKTINDKEELKTKILIENRGNTYQWNIPITLSSSNLITSDTNITIPSLAPFEFKEIPVTLKASVKNTQSNGELTIISEGKSESYQIRIVPYYYQIIFWIGGITISLTAIFVILRLLRKNEPHF